MLFEILRTTRRQLLRKRLRTVLTVAGIAVGTLLISLVSFLGNAGKNMVGQELRNMGLDGLSVSADTDGALTEDVLANLRNMHAVTAAMPLAVQFTGGTIGVYDGDVMLCGIDAGADQVIALQETWGRLLSDGDVNGGRAVCVIDEGLAVQSYGRENILGKTLRVRFGDREESFSVVGISKAGSSLLQNVSGYVPPMVYVPYTTLRDLTGDESFDQIAVRMNDGSDRSAATAAVRRMLERTDTVGADYALDDLASQREKLNGLMDIVGLVLTVISAVSLLVAGISIMTIMLVSVHERTKEIGIKKAIGATDGRIMTEFMTEAILLTLTGSVCGLTVAVAIAVIGGAVSGIPIAIPLRTVAGVIAFSVGLGIVFGVYPARKAASLPPATALHGGE